jgi:hypothetical protein
MDRNQVTVFTNQNYSHIKVIINKINAKDKAHIKIVQQKQ